MNHCKLDFKKKYISKLLASWFGVGYLPLMPGTWGSLAAMLLSFALLHLNTQHLCFVFFAIAICLTFIGVLVCGVCYKDHENSFKNFDYDPSFDPSWIVIDEVAGYFWAVGMASVVRPVSLISLVIAFAFFRFFDIKKVGPVGWVETHYGSKKETAALGIMADDVVAGILAGLLTLVVIY